MMLILLLGVRFRLQSCCIQFGSAQTSPEYCYDESIGHKKFLLSNLGFNVYTLQIKRVSGSLDATNYYQNKIVVMALIKQKLRFDFRAGYWTSEGGERHNGLINGFSEFWWYPFNGFGGMPSKKPPKLLESTVHVWTPEDGKREKALDFSRALFLLRTSVYSCVLLFGARD